MRSLVEYVARNLVDHPQVVQVEERPNRGNITLTLTVHADDRGKVIGRNGRIAKAIRDVVGIVAARRRKHVQINFK